MFNKEKQYSVKNRSASRVFYTLPERNGLMRTFMPGEVKHITGDELQALSYRDGGQVLIDNYLLISDPDAKKEVVTNQEPEYDLDEKGVYELLTKGSDDQLIDCINFGPRGVHDLIKQIATDLPLNDLNKCQIIKDMLGYDVVYLVNLNKTIAEEEGTSTKPAPKKRRVAVKEEVAVEEAPATKPARRAAKPASNPEE